MEDTRAVYTTDQDKVDAAVTASEGTYLEVKLRWNKTAIIDASQNLQSATVYRKWSRPFYTTDTESFGHSTACFVNCGKPKQLTITTDISLTLMRQTLPSIIPQGALFLARKYFDKIDSS